MGGITEGIAAALVSAGIGETAAAIAAPALLGAAGGAALSGIEGGNPLTGAITGGLTGGAIGLGPVVGMSGIGGEALLGAAGGALGAGLTGGNVLQSAVGGGLAGGISGALATPAGAPAGAPEAGGTAGASAAAGAPAGVAVDPTSAATTLGTGAGTIESAPIGPVGGGGAGAGAGGVGAGATGATENMLGFQVPAGTGAAVQGGGVPLSAPVGPQSLDITFPASALSGAAGAGGAATPAGTDPTNPLGPGNTLPTTQQELQRAAGADLNSTLDQLGIGKQSPGFIDKLKTQFSADPMKTLGVGVAGAGLVANTLRGNALPGQNDLKSEAQAMGAQGQQLASYLQSGTLPPNAQAALDQATNDAINTIKSKYAGMGIDPNNSSAAQQEIMAVKSRAQAQGFNMAATLLQQGIQETNLSANIYTQLLNIQGRQAQESGSALSNLAFALAGGAPRRAA